MCEVSRTSMEVTSSFRGGSLDCAGPKLRAIMRVAHQTVLAARTSMHSVPGLWEKGLEGNKGKEVTKRM